MYPELFHFGSFTVYSYGTFILLGVIAGYFTFLRFSKPWSLNHDKVSELFLWCAFGVFAGGKLFFFLEQPGHFIKHPEDMLKDLGSGFVFYGSFLFTLPILIWWFRRNKLPVWEMFDLVGISGALVHAFGKIGCFMAGCCHGKTCSAAWGVVFTHAETRAEPTGVPLYPVQLWDSAIIFGAVLFMLWLRNRKQFAGQLFLIYGIWYAVGRFITEYFRGDAERGYLFNGALSHSQFIAILVFLAASGIYVYRFRKAPIKP